MASKTNMNKIIRACYDLNQDWNKELNEKEGELNHRIEVAEEYINIKDEELEKMNSKYHNEKQRRKKAENELKIRNKYRKENLNLVMDIRYRHSLAHRSAPKNLLVDHMDKLMICATNLYESITDIYEDRKRETRAQQYDCRTPWRLCYKINRSQQDIKDRKIHPGPTWGIVTDSSVSPTRHPADAYKLRSCMLMEIKRKGQMVEEARRREEAARAGFEDSDSDSD